MSRSTVSVSLLVNSASPADWNHSWDSGIQTHGYARHPFLDENPTQHGLCIPQHPRSLETFAFSMVSSKFVFSFTWLNTNFIEMRMFRIHSAIICAGRRGARTRKQKRVGNVPNLILSPFLNHMKYVNIFTIYGVMNISRGTGCPGIAEPPLLPTG